MKARAIVSYSIATYMSVLYHCWAFTWLEKGSKIVETTPGTLIVAMGLTVFAFLVAKCFAGGNEDVC